MSIRAPLFLFLFVLCSTLHAQHATATNKTDQPTGSELKDENGKRLAVNEPQQDPDPHEFVMLDQVPVPLNYEEVRREIGFPLLACNGEVVGRVLIRVLLTE